METVNGRVECPTCRQVCPNCSTVQLEFSDWNLALWCGTCEGGKCINCGSGTRRLKNKPTSSHNLKKARLKLIKEYQQSKSA